MKNYYKRLGNYIHEVKIRNSDLKAKKLLGLSINKCFISSIANTIGTDMSTYRIIKSTQFAYCPVTSRNGEKITIAFYTENETAIISQAYTVFEVIDNEKLLPEYLMMWFSRTEFDRFARFKSHGSAREIFDWKELCETLLPIPPIETQKQIVSEYHTIQNRINLNNQIIQKLEQTAQAIYKKMFIDDIDPENLPHGWKIGTIGEYCKKMKSGGTPSRTNNNFWDKKDFSWLKSGEVHNNIIFDAEEYISESGLKNSSAKLIPKNSVIMAMYGATAAQVGFLDCETSTNQACCNIICNTKKDAAFLFFHLMFNQDEIKRMANGGAQENLGQDLISNLAIIIFEDKIKQSFEVILNQIIDSSKENVINNKLQELLLSKLSTIGD